MESAAALKVKISMENRLKVYLSLPVRAQHCDLKWHYNLLKPSHKSNFHVWEIVSLWCLSAGKSIAITLLNENCSTVLRTRHWDRMPGCLLNQTRGKKSSYALEWSGNSGTGSCLFWTPGGQTAPTNINQPEVRLRSCWAGCGMLNHPAAGARRSRRNRRRHWC